MTAWRKPWLYSCVCGDKNFWMFVSKPWVGFYFAEYGIVTSCSCACSVESAYFAVKPPERVAKEMKELSTVQSYVQYLLMVKLDNPGSVTGGIDGIIKYNWFNKMWKMLILCVL
jgi:hypothetical protein